MFPMNVKGRRGFTVVEAAIGIMVFLVAMVGVTIVFTSGGGAIHQSVRGSQANQLASEKLAEICRREFYIPFDGTNPQDIDDGEMVGGSIDTYYNTAVGNIDQLTNPGFANNYGDIAGYPNCKMAIAVQYQELVPESPVPVPDTGEVIGSPVPAMKAGWGPITVGNDEPFDDVGIKLNLIKVQVTVYYRSASGDVDVACTVDALVNYNEVDVGPKVYSVSPSGFELNHLHSFTVYGDDFSDDTADNSVKPTVKITKTGFSDELVSVDGANSTKTMLKCTATVTQPHGASSIYWDVKVINIDNMANSLARCLYEIEDTP
ncbi:MAG: hypothetical protein L6433_02955, partial [Actinomycetia bacterium]|nr:hypothetical protein [Actinomycetes bacterium]